MYLDFSPAIVSQNRLNPIMQRAKNDRSVLRALPVYDNADIQNLCNAASDWLFKKKTIIQSKPAIQYPVPVVTYLCNDSGTS